MTKPYISVIMNTYNANQQWLLDAVRSYTYQTNVNIQLIISTVAGDPSIKTLKNYNVDFVISDEPGIYTQLNKALKAIKGDWYAYASSDDVARRTKLIEEYTAAIKHNAKVVYSGYNLVNSNLGGRQLKTFQDFNIADLLRSCFISDCALIHRSIINKYGPFDLACGNLAYYDLWFRIYEGEGNIFYSLKKATWNYRQHGSQNKRKWQKDSEKRKIQMALTRMVKAKHQHLTTISV